MEAAVLEAWVALTICNDFSADVTDEWTHWRTDEFTNGSTDEQADGQKEGQIDQ